MLTRRAVLTRLVVGASLVAAIATLGDLHLEATPSWRSPALAATSRGLLLAWVEGPSESSYVWARPIGTDLRPRGAARRLASVPPASQLALSRRGARTHVLVRPYMDAILLRTLDDRSRPVQSHDADGWPLMKAVDLEAEGLTSRSGRRRVPLGQPEYDRFPNSGPCAWGRPWQAAAVLRGDDRVVACVEPAAAGRVWRIRARGTRRELARLEGAHCPPGAEYGCVAAVEQHGRLVVAWVRRSAFGRSFVLSRVGGRELVLEREAASTGVAGFGASGLVLAWLLLRALAELRSMARLHRALGPERRSVVLSGQLREGRLDQRGGWRMKLGASCLGLDDGTTVQISPGEPLVVTLPALRGDLPRSARAVGLFERVHVVGVEVPPEPPFARALRSDLLSDAPVDVTRRSVRIRLAIVAVDATALLGIVGTLLAVLGR